MSESYDELAFSEEKEHLERIETTLDEMISSEDKKCETLRDDLRGFRAYDYDDVENRRDMNESLNWHLEQLSEYRGYKPSPYFAHMDFEQGAGKKASCFVGKKGLTRSSDIVIMDWRSPVGQTFYQKREKKFKINDYLYQLRLRRAVDIQNAVLRSVSTEYDATSTTSLDADIIDPFLLSVLREKKADHRLTDIIRTIQENQDDIIAKPHDESFIVQGCAGSGKTMILLHRLSYLAYNRPGMDFSKYCILTPNKQFNAHINELSTELELERIKKWTVEEYYAYLFNTLSSVDQVYKKGDEKPQRKVKALSAEVKSEANLNSDMLAEIYSETFQDAVTAWYHKHWDDVAQKIKSVPLLHDALNALGKGLPDLSRHTFSTYRLATMTVGECLRRTEELENGYQNAVKTLPSTDTLLARALADVKKYHDEMFSAQDGSKEHKIATERYKRSLSNVTSLETNKKKKETIIAEYQKITIPTQQILKALKDAQMLLQALDYLKINERANEGLAARYTKYNQKRYKRPINYRHRLYFNLLICSLYYGVGQKFESFVCIDEAQDLAVTEYKLLRNVLGKQCIFNLYGDFNQLVYKYKGVRNWVDISDCITEKVYFLNENYRNSTQITNYCNDAFEADVIAIGLPGEDVVEATLDIAIVRMLKEKKNNASVRAAIIYKKGVAGLDEIVAQQIPQEMLSLNEVDTRKISVITAEMAKGLEFESVIAIVDYMDANEKYIAFTRALQNLCVATCPMLSFAQDVVEADENSGTEEVLEWQYDMSDWDVEAEMDEPESENVTALTLLPVRQLPDMPDHALHMSIEEGMGYIQRFFESDVASMQTFIEIGKYISQDDSDIILRVSREFIGFAKTDEKTRVYVSRKKDKGCYIKFKHLNDSEPYDVHALARYLKECNQCNQYAKSYAILMKFTKK